MQSAWGVSRWPSIPKCAFHGSIPGIGIPTASVYPDGYSLDSRFAFGVPLRRQVERRASSFLFAAAAALLAGCSLVTALSGLSGGPEPTSTDGGDGGSGDDLDGATAASDAGDGAATADGASPDAATKVARIYVFGGTTDTGTVATVLHADVLPDGTLASWETDGLRG